MKVLLATWSWYSVGGDWTYIENIIRLYESNGIEVVPFSTKNEKNISNKYEKYFIKAYDYKHLNNINPFLGGVKALKNSIISLEALSNIDSLLDDNPDIAFAHLHIIHHWITPSIIWKLKNRGIPVIWSLHEYKILCPEGTFVSNEKICEKCYSGKFYNCALNRCKKQSFLASLLASIDAYFYNLSGIYNKVDKFLCPSQFLLEKFAQFGLNKSKLALSNYCYDIHALDQYIKENDCNIDVPTQPFILYVGRIEKLKGVKTLIDAVSGTDIKLKIAGTGSILEDMQNFVTTNEISNVEFLGFQTKKKVYDLTITSLCVVCPSEWYENYPFSIIESLLFSKPVVGANIGGIPELVIDGKTGFLHEPGDVLGLRNALLKIWTNPLLAEELGANARRYASELVNFNTHWDFLKGIIKSLPIKQNI